MPFIHLFITNNNLTKEKKSIVIVTTKKEVEKFKNEIILYKKTINLDINIYWNIMKSRVEKLFKIIKNLNI